MKSSRLTLGIFAATLLTVGTSAFAARVTDSTAVAANSCGPNNVRCMEGYDPQCNTDGRWQCVKNGSSSTSSRDICIAECADGYEYRTCTEDGHPINYFADPCMNHQASSESNENSCGASAILCIQGTIPACVKNEWTCVPQAGTSSSQADLQVTSLSPESGGKFSRVTITGTGFARRNNIVLFADSVIPHLRSLDGKHLSFRVPARTVRACYLQRGMRCTAEKQTYGSGEYDVSVLSGDQVSNRMTFTVR